MYQKDNENIMETIDRLFDENRPGDARDYMLQELEKAKQAGDSSSCLLLLNELIGYYRQTSEKEPLRSVINEALLLLEQMEIDNSISYATTLINIANASRSMGELEAAKTYYIQAENIYTAKEKSGEISGNDMRLAGLYNNLSLLYQEMSDYEMAKEQQLKALKISLENNAGFEIAVSHANLANTYLLANDYIKAEEYANKALELFEKRNVIDPHYCAALSVLGNCALHDGDLNKAGTVFRRALHIVESTIGRNSQYERLLESLKMCGLKGMELSELYYKECVEPMIREKFPEYEQVIAAGLVGEGSDCYGFDDSFSLDHDAGADVCLWLSDEVYEQIGERLKEEYELLPSEFYGVKRNPTDMGKGRRGVCRISDFYIKYLGTSDYEKIAFDSVPDYALAACTNGKVFKDINGEFTSMRKRLQKGYPASVRLRKMAEAAAMFSQCGQYNYARMMKRGDGLTAQIMISDFCKWTMKLYHYFYNMYPPHDKWLAKSTALLPEGAELLKLLNHIIDSKDADKVTGMVEQVAEFMAQLMYDSGDISDTDAYIGNDAGELLFKADIAELSAEELSERIARLEFTAFDKVKNEGGRASCQNNWPTFSIMRRSQYLLWNKEMLMQYLYDFTREYNLGHNLITEKYGRMMQSTAPEKYEELKMHFPEISDAKQAVIEQIVTVQMQMAESFAKVHPKVAGNARNLHTFEDEMFDTSYETYLRGEISTYSDKMLQLYGRFVAETARDGGNIAYMTIENTARLYGFKNLEEFEAKV